ncbi:MAG: DUF3179 domain-containing protein [Pseudomonadota bacterium]
MSLITRKPTLLLITVLTAPLWLAYAGMATAAPTKNGFDLVDALIAADEVLPGGPPRDGIPAIDRPRFVSAATADFLREENRVLGVVRNGVKKAYPISIMNWHEIVNDRFGNEAIAVTYCPLCGTGMAFLAEAAGIPLTFGVSGLLYNSDMLLYDRQTQSLWSQIAAQAISGTHKGHRLAAIPVSHTTWSDWRQRHPDTLVLSQDTGFTRDYHRSPYAGYETSRELFFPVKFRARGYHPKERVLGLGIGGRHKAYPFAELSKTTGTVRDRVAGKDIEIRFDAEHQTATAVDETGRELATVIAYWFAWYGFHPETDIYTHDE